MGKNKLGSGVQSSLWKSEKAIAIPVTFLMLFASLTLIVTATYYLAVTKVNSESRSLKVSAAKSRMFSLEETIGFITWSPGSYQIFEFDDYGGMFKAEPAARRLVMNLTQGQFYDVFFNSSIGKVSYQQASSDDSNDFVFLRGDSRVVVNQSSSTMTQLYVAMGVEAPEVTLSYRPLAGSTVTESGNGKPTNNLRIYIVNLNSSRNMTLQGEFRLKATCVNITSTWKNYNFTTPLTTVTLKVNLAGTSGAVLLPVSSNVNGAYVNLETVTCNIKIQDAGES